MIMTFWNNLNRTSTLTLIKNFRKYVQVESFIYIYLRYVTKNRTQKMLYNLKDDQSFCFNFKFMFDFAVNNKLLMDRYIVQVERYRSKLTGRIRSRTCYVLHHSSRVPITMRGTMLI